MAKAKTTKAKPASATAAGALEPTATEITLGKAVGKHRLAVRRADGSLIGHLRGATDFESMAHKFRVDALAAEVQRLASAGIGAEGIDPDDPRIAECGRRTDELFGEVFEVEDAADPPDPQEREEILGRFFERSGSTLSNNPVIRRLIAMISEAASGESESAAGAR